MLVQQIEKIIVCNDPEWTLLIFPARRRKDDGVLVFPSKPIPTKTAKDLAIKVGDSVETFK